jgi:chloramphenicol-sensitive protein RarD
MSRTLGAGVLASAGAYLIWGLFPLYWNLLEKVPVVQVLAHRAVWCAICVWIWLALLGQGRWWRGLDRRVLLMLIASSALISLNWGVYIHGVTSGHVLDTSLGYFITPLLSVVLGVVLLRERLGAWQWLAVAFAAFGVGWLAVRVGTFPWIALTLAATFGTYGLIRKLAAVDAARGLAVESWVMLPLAAAYLAWQESAGRGAFLHGPVATDLLLVLGGVVTAVPLALFAYGARRVALSTMGFMQYLAPTLQFLCGVFVFHETFDAERSVAFISIWIALAIFTADSVRRWRVMQRESPAA